MKALLAFSRVVDRLNEFVGRLVKWLVLAATLVSAGNALIRYGLHSSSNAWLELQCGIASARCSCWRQVTPSSTTAMCAST